MRGVMRRPICMLGLTYVTVLFLYFCWKPYTEASYEMYEGCTVTVTGQVEKKEERISNGQKVLTVYLKNVQFLDSASTKSQIVNQDITNLDSSNKIPNTLNLNITNKEKAAKDSIGLLCYMESTEGSMSEPKTGSLVCMEGRFREFAHATNPGEFDAKSFYQIQNLCGRLQHSQVIEESREYDRFREGLYQIRQYFAGLLEVSFAPREASVMRAMLLGEKSLLDDEVKMLYQLNGVIHILSISGLHISIIGMGIYKILCRLHIPDSVVVIVSVTAMYSYAVMTGMSVSANRAVMMFALHIAAKLCKRTYDMLTAIAIAAVLILLEQPLYLYHSGFLFSFGAVLGIGLLAPVVEENWIGSKKICKVMSANLAVSVFTLPVYLYFYYEYPLYSLFLNLLILPGTSLLVTDGLISIAGAAWKMWLGKWLAIPANLLLSLYEIGCTVFLWLPGSRNITGQIAMCQIAISAGFVILALFMNHRFTKLQVWMCLLLSLFCLTKPNKQEFQLTFLDVGQGDCIFIADGNGGHYLIDGGSSTKSETGTYQIIPFLKAEGVAFLDAVYITHMDEDHYNGIEELLEQVNQNGIPVRRLVLPELCEKNKTTEYEEIIQLASVKEIPVLFIKAGDSLKHGEMELTCLYPEGCAAAGDESGQCSHASLTTNEASMVLSLRYGKFDALFTGDLEGTGEEIVRDRVAKNKVTGEGVTLLKVAHHGSKNATSEEFLKTLQPDIAIISCGKNNRYGHPHEETLERLHQIGSKVMSTHEYGAITIKVGEKIVIEPFVLLE